MILYLIHGQMRTGKDQFGAYLKEMYDSYSIPTRIIKFADALKEDCERYYKPLLETINDALFASLQAIPTDHQDRAKIEALISTEKNWYDVKTPVTRLLLQISGTEFARSADDDVWVKRMVKSIREDVVASVFINTDTRFENEVFLEEHFTKGERANLRIVRIKVVRPQSGRTSGIKGHASEQDLPDDWFDFIVENVGTLEDLKDSATKVFLKTATIDGIGSEHP